MNSIVVFNNTTGANKSINLLPGATVADALAQAGVSSEGSMVRVNQQEAALDQPLGDGDRVSVTKKGLKGAQMRTFDQLLNAETACQAAGNDLVAAAQAERDKKSRDQLVKVYETLLAQAEGVERDVEVGVQRLGQQLADARAHYNKVTFVVSELRAGRPFPFYALQGNKAVAIDLCKQLGVAVPPNDSECWNTTPPAADAGE